MASGYEVEVTISSARDLKNVNWRHGDIKPYAVVWVDPNAKCSTKVDEYGDTSPTWDETLVIPLRAPIENSTLFIDVVHVNAAEDVKPLIGSARVPLREIVDDVGIGGRCDLKLKLKRPSGRPHGKVEVKVVVRQPRYRAPDPYYAPPYGVPPPQQSRDYGAYGVPPPPPPQQSRDYGAPQQYNYQYASPYQAGGPPGGYSSYDPSPYNQQGQYEEKKKSKFGMGTGLAVGAVAGVLGGIALVEGAEYVENKIADDAAEKVEDDEGYDDDDYGGGGDDDDY